MNRDTIRTAAFSAFQVVESLNYDIMMAYAHVDRDSLHRARETLAKALAIADAALSEAAVEGEALEKVQ